MVKPKEENAFELVFMHAKPVKMLVSLKSESVRYASQVAKTVDCTYSHTVKVLENFKDLGLVKFEKKGRIKIIKLTDVGLEVAHDFEGIHRKFLKIKIPSPESLSDKSRK